jgi:hypothetical protein
MARIGFTAGPRAFQQGSLNLYENSMNILAFRPTVRICDRTKKKGAEAAPFFIRCSRPVTG